ncbi:MAG: flavin reductase family protein [Acidobacteria bacterium]|nr:flavin reductase family protein [Acidobacteriota bacterium]
MAIDPGDFRRALGQLATGVTVVTTRDAAGRPLGLTVSAFCSVSLEPPLVLVSIDDRSEAHDGFESSGLFAVSILAEGQEEYSRRFATGGPAKFEGAELLTSTTGLPLVPEALAHIECRVAATLPGGDHTIYLGEVLGLDVRPGRPLLYHAGAYRSLDPEPGPELGGGRRDRV